MQKLLLLLALFVTPLVRADNPQRIVTIGGDVTEIICALGHCDNIVARDTTSMWPEPVIKKPDIGYMRLLEAEPIFAQNPELVIASKESRPPLVLQHLRNAKIPLVMIDSDKSVDNVANKIKEIAAALHETDKGEQLIARYQQQLASIARTPVNTRVMLLNCFRGQDCKVAGGNTGADSIIRTSGAINVAGNYSGYQTMTAESIITSKPDLIVMTTRGLSHAGGEAQIWQIPGLLNTPAGQHKRLFVGEDMALLGFTLRTPEVLAELRQAVEQAQGDVTSR